MIILFLILVLLASVALGFIVLVQNPKGGGLAGSVGGLNNQFMGVKQTTDVLEKGTWVLLTLIVVVSLAITTVGKSGGGVTGGESEIQKQIDNSATPSPIGGNRANPSTTPAKTGDTSKK